MTVSRTASCGTCGGETTAAVEAAAADLGGRDAAAFAAVRRCDPVRIRSRQLAVSESTCSTGLRSAAGPAAASGSSPPANSVRGVDSRLGLIATTAFAAEATVFREHRGQRDDTRALT